ncbi:MAG: LTA synthase family protein, partial [Desulfobulbaceae bacterium]|nr:LTA synthase family protein [Desulfobulbaceae bacterium]
MRNRYVLFVEFFCLYSQLFVILGGIVTAKLFLRQYLEWPLLFYLFWYLNVLIKASRWQALIAATPLFLCYLGPDISFLLLGRVFRLTDLNEVPELVSVMSPFYLIVASGVIIGCLLFLVFSLSLKRWKTAIFGALPLAALVIAVEIFPQQFVNAFQLCGREVVFWSDAESVINNGRFAMLCYREAERRLARAKTDTFYNREAYDQEALDLVNWLKEKGNRRNVHLVVMESFVDPTLFMAVTYSQSPMHPDYKKMFAGRMGYSLSPVFGGRTSQAEFEALCGVPAYEELGGVDFNSFSGSEAWCLPGILRQSGYRAVASNSFKPNFFNAVDAYHGIGFGEQHFPQEYSLASDSYLSTGDVESETFMFDGDLFAQNREFVRQALAEKDHPPLFNYLLTMYGHEPYTLDEKKRPQFIRATSKYRDSNLELVANQFWYRSQAVAEHVRELTKIDPDGLIIIVSDHLPHLNGLVSYQKLRYLGDGPGNRYMNRILIIDRGEVRQYKTIHHYDIPRLILDALTGGAFSGAPRGEGAGMLKAAFTDP